MSTFCEYEYDLNHEFFGCDTCLHKLSTQIMELVNAYITANYTPNSEVAERERAARIDEIRRTRPHLTYPGMVYYGERMNELRSDETEEI